MFSTLSFSSRVFHFFSSRRALVFSSSLGLLAFLGFFLCQLFIAAQPLVRVTNVPGQRQNDENVLFSVNVGSELINYSMESFVWQGLGLAVALTGAWQCEKSKGPAFPAVSGVLAFLFAMSWLINLPFYLRSFRDSSPFCSNSSAAFSTENFCQAARWATAFALATAAAQLGLAGKMIALGYSRWLEFPGKPSISSVSSMRNSLFLFNIFSVFSYCALLFSLARVFSTSNLPEPTLLGALRYLSIILFLSIGASLTSAFGKEFQGFPDSGLSLSPFFAILFSGASAASFASFLIFHGRRVSQLVANWLPFLNTNSNNAITSVGHQLRQPLGGNALAIDFKDDSAATAAVAAFLALIFFGEMMKFLVSTQRYCSRPSSEEGAIAVQAKLRSPFEAAPPLVLFLAKLGTGFLLFQCLLSLILQCERGLFDVFQGANQTYRGLPAAPVISLSPALMINGWIIIFHAFFFLCMFAAVLIAHRIPSAGSWLSCGVAQVCLLLSFFLYEFPLVVHLVPRNGLLGNYVCNLLNNLPDWFIEFGFDYCACSQGIAVLAIGGACINAMLAVYSFRQFARFSKLASVSYSDLQQRVALFLWLSLASFTIVCLGLIDHHSSEGGLTSSLGAHKFYLSGFYFSTKMQPQACELGNCPWDPSVFTSPAASLLAHNSVIFSLIFSFSLWFSFSVVYSPSVEISPGVVASPRWLEFFRLCACGALGLCLALVIPFSLYSIRLLNSGVSSRSLEVSLTGLVLLSFSLFFSFATLAHLNFAQLSPLFQQAPVDSVELEKILEKPQFRKFQKEKGQNKQEAEEKEQFLPQNSESSGKSSNSGDSTETHENTEEFTEPTVRFIY